MPIAGVSDIRRAPRIGKLRLGIKTANDRGKEYPTPVDYFVCNVDKSTPQWAADAFHRVYGDKPRFIDIMFPCEEIDRFFPQDYRRYGAGTGLICKGDGIRASCMNKETGVMTEIVCPGQDCEFYLAKQCRHVGTLQFLLPKVDGLGVWQIDTTSFHSIVNINSGIDFIRAMTGAKPDENGGLIGGRIAMIPLKLAVSPKEVSPDGRKKTVYVLSIANDQIKLEDLIKSSTLSPIQILLPELDLDTPPDDLYPQSLINPGAVEETKQEMKQEAKTENPTPPAISTTEPPPTRPAATTPQNKNVSTDPRITYIVKLIEESGATKEEISVLLDNIIPTLRTKGKTDWKLLISNQTLYDSVKLTFTGDKWREIYWAIKTAKGEPATNQSAGLPDKSAVHPLLKIIGESGATPEVANIIIEHECPGALQNGKLNIVRLSLNQIDYLSKLFSSQKWAEKFAEISAAENLAGDIDVDKLSGNIAQPDLFGGGQKL